MDSVKSHIVQYYVACTGSNSARYSVLMNLFSGCDSIIWIGLLARPLLATFTGSLINGKIPVASNIDGRTSLFRNDHKKLAQPL